MLLTPGRGGVVRTCAASRRHNHSKVNRGGAIPPSLPPSKSFPIPFYIQAATISSEKIQHNSIRFYKIIVYGIGNSSWAVYKRFSDFQHLHDRITSITSIEIPFKFPPRHWLSFFTALTAEEEMDRYTCLERWFTAVLEIANSELRPKGASTFDVNQIKDSLNMFLEMKENFATALKESDESELHEVSKVESEIIDP